MRLLAEFAAKKAVDLTVVGPELPLTLGIVDEFEGRDLRIFGATRQAAILEGSKVFAKRLMKKYKIPTGFFQTFYRAEDAKRYIQDVGAPIVVKADGLAAGKGAIVCPTVQEAVDTVKRIMEDRVFGDAGSRVVIEEFLTGEEASFLAFTDGETVLPMASTQDHKAAFDDDKGPNTGGMGAYSPAPVVTEALHQKIMTQVMIPTVKAMAAEGRPYRGVLYAGLMIKDGDVKVLEYNVRFGDPEAQPLFMRMESDLLPVLEAVTEQRLRDVEIRWRPEPAVCVVMTAGGYPGAHDTDKPITGLAAAARLKDVMVFHAGTARVDNTIVTQGGRVLGVTALGMDIPGRRQPGVPRRREDPLGRRPLPHRHRSQSRRAPRVTAPQRLPAIGSRQSQSSIPREFPAIVAIVNRQFPRSFHAPHTDTGRAPRRAS